MALTGIEIFKLLPKTNCHECGLPTCLAFAMNLASGKADLSACPYVSEEARALLSQAEQSPVRQVTVGKGDGALVVGGESVLFRHEKRFENPPRIAMLVVDTLEGGEVGARLERFRRLRYELLGTVLRPELVAVRCDSGDPGRFASVVRRVAGSVDGGLVLMSDDVDVLSSGLEVCSDRRPLLHGATADNAVRVGELAVQHSCPVTARADGLDGLAELAATLGGTGVEEIVLDSCARDVRRAFEDQILIRRAALWKETLGFPTIVLPCEMSDEPVHEALLASVFVLKYGGIIVLSDLQAETLYPLLLLRMGIHSDPQNPLMAPEGIHEIGEPDASSPVLVTSSWALSYLLLRAEIEATRIDAFLCVERIEDETDVMCWCERCLRSSHRGNLDCEHSRRFVETCGIADRVSHRQLVISGRTAQYQADLEKVLPQWNIVVGPARADGMQAFLPRHARKLRTPR